MIYKREGQLSQCSISAGCPGGDDELGILDSVTP
nr:MAG TPA: hypothetical protein [Caudoviricetes sp.]